MNAPWSKPTGKVTRKAVKTEMELETREMSLNQRLLDKFYDRQRSELAGQIVELQRAYSEESGKQLA